MENLKGGGEPMQRLQHRDEVIPPSGSGQKTWCWESETHQISLWAAKEKALSHLERYQQLIKAPSRGEGTEKFSQS